MTAKGALGEILAGATRPSLPALLGILGLLAAQIGLLAWWATPERLAGIDPASLAGSPIDYGAYASARAWALAHEPHPEPGVVITGGSAARDCIESERALAEQLTSLAGEPVRVHLLATNVQAVWETAALVDQVPPDFRGVVVLPIGPTTLTLGQDRMRMARRSLFVAVDSPWMRSAGLAPDGVGVFLFDHLFFFTTRAHSIALAWLRGDRPALQEHTYPDGSVADARAWRGFQRAVRDRLADASYRRPNLRVLNGLLRRLRARPDLRPVLLLPPLHPDVPSLLGPGYRAYRARLAAVARAHGVELWALDAAADLDAGDFYDWTHLNDPAARRRFQDALARRLAPLLAAEPVARDAS